MDDLCPCGNELDPDDEYCYDCQESKICQVCGDHIEDVIDEHNCPFAPIKENKPAINARHYDIIQDWVIIPDYFIRNISREIMKLAELDDDEDGIFAG